MPYGGNRYNFSSPGAAATDALTQFLAEREAQKRQAMLDDLATQTRTRQQGRQDEADTEARTLFAQQQQDRVAAQEAAAVAQEDKARASVAGDIGAVDKQALISAFLAEEDPKAKAAIADQLLLKHGVRTPTPAQAVTPKRIMVDTVVNGQHVKRYMTEDEAAAAGDIPAYDRPQATGGGGGGGGGMAGLYNDIDPEAIAKSIQDGEMPPDISALGRPAGAAVASHLAKKGFNLATARQDWQATTRRFASLNSTQQARLLQATDTAYHSLDVIDALADEWNAGRFPPLTRLQVTAAKNGLLGPVAQNIATQLEAQITDITSELANVYMGGNSPTDQSLKLAAHNLSASWSKDQLKGATKLARTNLQIRRNAMANVQIVSPSGAANPYAGTPAAAPAAQPAAQTPAYRWNSSTGKLEKVGG